MIVNNIGYNRVEARWRHDRRVKLYRLYRSIPGGPRKLIAKTAANCIKDTVPAALSQQTYVYVLEKSARQSGYPLPDEQAETSKTDWCEDLLPMPYLPEHPQWLALYRKAWELTWHRIITSPKLPNRHSYCDYPDNHMVAVWDTCFCSLFQRYAAIRQAHPCPATLDNFYAAQQLSGYIGRAFRTDKYEWGVWGIYRNRPSPGAINPPILSWAEWNYYLISADKKRLARVLPKLVKYHEFIEKYLKDKPGYYRWHAHGSGWDNINDNQGENAIYYFVDMAAQQAFAARWIARIAEETGNRACRDHYRRFLADQKKLIDKIYWNDKENWYCSLTKERKFTRKTLAGIWPMMAQIADRAKAQKAVKKTLMNPACFLTAPMPLPTLAKDEPGYNPLGEYWLGGVWVNMSLAAIRGTELYGLDKDAFALATKTLDGMARVYNEYADFPRSLWECYAPEAVGPASHKIVAPDKVGGVREEFGGWACCLINILIEDVLGFKADAPRNTLTWKINLASDHGIDRLCFGKTRANIRIHRSRSGRIIETQCNQAFKLQVIDGKKTTKIPIRPGSNEYVLPDRGRKE